MASVYSRLHNIEADSNHDHWNKQTNNNNNNKKGRGQHIDPDDRNYTWNPAAHQQCKVSRDC